MTNLNASRPMSRPMPTRTLAVAALAALVLAGCTERPKPGPTGPQASQVPWGAYPTGGDAHATHAGQGLQCGVCHDCGQYAFQPGYRLPSGALISTGTITRDAAGATCTVACHSPFGAPANPVKWTTVGPLACVDCHLAQGPTLAATVTAHVGVGATPAANRAACQQCHDTSAHLTGVVRVIQGDGTVTSVTSGDDAAVNALCRTCHGGNGRLLDGQTAPVLPAGWEDVKTGDWHGPRAGPTFGTGLAAPYKNGQPAMACTACHDPHRAGNAFLLADTVNGQGIPAGAISQNGVGAEVLCAKCHTSQRHLSCLACHTEKMPPPTTMAYGPVPDPTGHPLDPAPAGSPCFFCHGHEGLRNIWVPATPPPTPAQNTWMCDHCHGERPVPAGDLTPPVITPGSVVVQGLLSSAATVTWTTDEAASSVVEWGLTQPTKVAGDAVTLTQQHQVTLSGLTPSTSYVYRVRSSDIQRNVTISPVYRFTTSAGDQPQAPVLQRVANVSTFNDFVPVRFAWRPSTALPGHTLQYRVQLSHTPDFATVLQDTGWIDGLTWNLTLASSSDDAEATYYWRVMAQDATSGAASSWSAVNSFWLFLYP